VFFFCGKQRNLCFLLQKGEWQLWQLIVMIAGIVVGITLVIVVTAACLYRRARTNDKSRRYLDSDSENETEPLISAISSKAMRQVLAKVCCCFCISL
jgi:heme/copper-type cytochrome/quinol oxidase subunit 2